MNSIYVAPTKEEPPQPSTPYLEENPKWACTHDMFYHVTDDLHLSLQQEQHMSYWRQDEATKSKQATM